MGKCKAGRIVLQVANSKYGLRIGKINENDKQIDQKLKRRAKSGAYLILGINIPGFIYSPEATFEGIFS
jgi:hypothetical protein